MAVAEKLKMEWRRLLPKLLQVEEAFVHLHITECVLSELRSLGPEHQAAKDAAARISVIKCRHKHGHTDGMDPGACIRDLVGKSNTGRWIVLTQDADLRADLRNVAGTPLMLVSSNVLVLEPPSAASKANAAATEATKAGLSKEEAKAVKAALKDGAAGAGASSSAAGRSTSDVLAGGYRDGAIDPRVGVPAWAVKGPKAPNPLSNRKRKERPGSHDGDDGVGDGASTIARKHRRKQKGGGSGRTFASSSDDHDGGEE